MTPLNKSVTRKSGATVRDGSRQRELVVTLYPGGTLGLRPAATRREECISLSEIYALAVRRRVHAMLAEKRANRRVKS